MAKPFELKCAGYQIKSARIGHGGGGTVFRCTLGPISDDVLEALADAVRAKRVIRFAFPQRPLLLEAVDLRRLDPGFIRIGGRVVDGDSRATATGRDPVNPRSTASSARARR